MKEIHVRLMTLLSQSVTIYHMSWWLDFQLFLFDFDGLLVNTEALHFDAYQRMCSQRGYFLDWTYEEFSKASHFDPTLLEKKIYEKFPSLKKDEPTWAVLYAEKKKNYLHLLEEKGAPLMPGVEAFLTLLFQKGSRMCVVTHSPSEQIHAICEKN